MVRDDSAEEISANEAALRLGMSRERLIRRIQTGEIEGGQRTGRWWFVTRAALESARAERPQGSGLAGVELQRV